MREVKFRGINHETGKFVYGSYARMLRGIRLYDAIISIENGELIEYYIHSNKTIGQYTGLTGKNGVEIYEGDIVKCEVRNGKLLTRFIAAVKFSNVYHSFMAVGVKQYFGRKSYLHELYMPEVIGSIHENPELLEDKHG